MHGPPSHYFVDDFLLVNMTKNAGERVKGEKLDSPCPFSNKTSGFGATRAMMTSCLKRIC